MTSERNIDKKPLPQHRSTIVKRGAAVRAAGGALQSPSAAAASSGNATASSADGGGARPTIARTAAMTGATSTSAPSAVTASRV